MNKTGAFALGVITGIVALGVTAVIVEGWDDHHAPYIPNGDDANDADDADNCDAGENKIIYRAIES